MRECPARPARCLFSGWNRDRVLYKSTEQEQCGGSTWRAFIGLFSRVANREKYHPLLAGKKPVIPRCFPSPNFFAAHINPSIKDFVADLSRRKEPRDERTTKRGLHRERRAR